MTKENDVDPVICSRGIDHDTALRALTGFMVSAFHSLSSTFYLFQLSDKLLVEQHHTGNLQATGTALPALFESFPETVSQVLNPCIVPRAGIPLLELNNGCAILSEKVMDTSIFLPQDTVYFRAKICMDYPPSGIKRMHIKRIADEVTEDEQVATAVIEEDAVVVAQEAAPPSDSSSLKLSANLSKAEKSYCYSYEFPFQEIEKCLKRMVFL